MPERSQTGDGPLQHRDTGVPQTARVGAVDGAGEIPQHRHRLAGLRIDVQRRLHVAPNAIGLGCHVHAERERRSCRIVQQSIHAFSKDLFGVVPRSPGVEGIRGSEPLLEHSLETFDRRRGQGGEVNSNIRGDVDQQRPFSSGVVDRSQSPGPGP
ncbi:MAG: hypothetical protein M3P01_07850, partial [Actinomycetota bacterium]|nr:hypothetical protein [Actinomycetota bacterium]